MKPVGIFGNNISKCPDIMRKGTPISPHRVPPVRSNKVKDYFSSVGSPCSQQQQQQQQQHQQKQQQKQQQQQQTKNDNKNKYISAIADPILTKLVIITKPTTETTKTITTHNNKNSNNNNKSQLF